MFFGVTNKDNEIPVLINSEQVKAIFPAYKAIDEEGEEFERDGTKIYLVGESIAIEVLDSYDAIKSILTEANNGRQ